MDSVIGVDLSGLSRATKGRTVAAHIALEDPLRLVELVTIRPGLRGDVDLLDWIRDREPVVVGIDAPLSLPHSVTCETVDCDRCEPGRASYLSRDVDGMAGGMPTVMLAAIAFRGMYLARQLSSSVSRVVEVYPGAAFSSWGLNHSRNAERAAALAEIVGPFLWTTRDEIDAVCAALLAASAWRSAAAVVSGADGEIVTSTSRIGG